MQLQNAPLLRETLHIYRNIFLRVGSVCSHPFALRICALIISSIFCPLCLFLSQLHPPDSSAPSRFVLTSLLLLISEILQVQLCDCISSCTMVNTTVHPIKVFHKHVCVCMFVCLSSQNIIFQTCLLFSSHHEDLGATETLETGSEVP